MSREETGHHERLKREEEEKRSAFEYRISQLQADKEERLAQRKSVSWCFEPSQSTTRDYIRAGERERVSD